MADVVATEPEAIAAAYESSVTPAQRRGRGVHLTPLDVAERLSELALAGLGSRPLVCDPACGAGSFLVAAGRVLERRGTPAQVVAAELLWGIDSDPAAVRAARTAIAAWSGVDPGDHIVCGDGLAAARRWPGRFDAVVGNPPFLSQLRQATARRRRVPAPLAGVRGAYTDTAWLFLAAAPALVRPGGRVVLIQPASLLAARDATAVREAVSAVAALEGMWTADDVFAAAVSVCAPVLRVGARARPVVARWRGRAVQPAPGVAAPLPATWSAALAAPDLPPLPADPTAVLGDIASATAGFRDQFYGLVPFTVDERDAPDHTHPRLITSGLIDLNGVSWGARPARYSRRTFAFPRVDLAALEREGDAAVARWVRARLLPKVVVATQTRVLEAAVDLDGTWVPSTPVITVHAPPDQLWRVAAAVLAPPATAWAVATRAGAALHPGAIKLSARQVLELPLPVDERQWDEGAHRLAAGDVDGAAEALTAAHRADPEVLEWWRRRVHA